MFEAAEIPGPVNTLQTHTVYYYLMLLMHYVVSLRSLHYIDLCLCSLSKIWFRDICKGNDTTL